MDFADYFPASAVAAHAIREPAGLGERERERCLSNRPVADAIRRWRHTAAADAAVVGSTALALDLLGGTCSEAVQLRKEPYLYCAKGKFAILLLCFF